MSKPPKIDRKTLKKPDEFVVQGVSFMERAAHYQKQILFAAVGIVVGAIAYYSFGWWQDRQLNQAWIAYNTAVSTEGNAKWGALEAFHKEYTNTRPGFLAAVALGDHAFEEQKKALFEKGETGKEHDAVKWYTEALKFGKLVPFEEQLLLINRGKAQELGKHWGEALADYEKAAAISGEAGGLAALNAGRALEQQGEREKASTQYDKVAAQYADTEYARLAKIYRRTLNSPLMAPGKSE